MIEHHHYFEGLNILNAHLKNILPRNVNVKRILFLIKDLIIHTDPIKHQSIFYNLKNNPDNVLYQLRCIIRLADISNELRCEDYSFFLFNKLIEEFKIQYNEYSHLHLVPPKFINDIIYNPYETQIYFIENNLIPLLTLFNNLNNNCFNLELSKAVTSINKYKIIEYTI